jgi:hypothetical protein
MGREESLSLNAAKYVGLATLVTLSVNDVCPQEPPLSGFPDSVPM